MSFQSILTPARLRTLRTVCLYGLIQSGKNQHLTVTAAMAVDNGFVASRAHHRQRSALRNQTLDRVKSALGAYGPWQEGLERSGRFASRLQMRPFAFV